LGGKRGGVKLVFGIITSSTSLLAIPLLLLPLLLLFLLASSGVTF